MKATLEFNLDDFDDKKAHIRATKATDAYIVLFSLREYLHSKEHEDALSALNEIMDNYGVSLEDLD